MLEVAAALLGNIKTDIKPPQVPELLEVQEQVQPAEWTVTPTASLPSLPTHPSPLPSQKAKKSRERATRADAIGATQWVWAYLEKNCGVPKWWRECQSLVQYPCDSTIQKLAHQQAAAFQIPTAQLENDGWWITPSCLEVLGQKKYLLKDFKGSCNYQEVRKEETIALAMAL